MNSAARVSCGLYKMLLFTYPHEFRQRFKCEMVSTFSDLICGEWEQKSVLGVARVWRSALGEVCSVAVPLHLQSPIVVTTSLALLSSFALFIAVFHAMTHVCDGK
jgi:hypothetical protein